MYPLIVKIILQKIKDQKYQWYQKVSNQRYFRKLKRVISLKIDFLRITISGIFTKTAYYKLKRLFFRI